MKNVYVVSKTHLDLSFTDYAENIRQLYIDKFIPDAIKLAKELNNNDEKKFVWTTGSWIMKEALRNSNSTNREELINALKRHDVVAHAMPFTLHTELLDGDTLDYGLSIIKELDDLSKRNKITAKNNR